MSLTFTQTLNGEAVSALESFGVINPATGAEFARVPEATDEQIALAARSSTAAFASDWSRDTSQRRQKLLEAHSVLMANADELARILVLEQGKPLRSAMGEVMAGALAFQYYAQLDIPRTVIQDDASAHVTVTHQPIGPVLAITAWNIPVLMACCKIAPALAAGNTVIVKPSPLTPASTLRIGELLREVFPSGVLTVLTGGAALGPKLTALKEVRKINMTGSVATGEKIAAAGAAGIRRVTLELGGNDAAILLDDVDPQLIAERLFWSAMNNSGQLCIAAKRIYVPRDLMDEVADQLAHVARRVVVGHGLDAETTMGPLQNRPQLDKVVEFVADARARGARIVVGGDRPRGDGNFHNPTIIAGAAHGMRIVDEEQFGPVMPLIPYDDVDEALTLANGTDFGLGGSVWSGNLERAASVAEHVHAGMVWVNTHGDNDFPRQPFGGVKSSGLGVELGPWGLLANMDSRVQYANVQPIVMTGVPA
jgi:acyl-CoA reductase-like NAD-dependent aldehyde dehydrogenase